MHHAQLLIWFAAFAAAAPIAPTAVSNGKDIDVNRILDDAVKDSEPGPGSRYVVRNFPEPKRDIGRKVLQERGMLLNVGVALEDLEGNIVKVVPALSADVSDIADARKRKRDPIIQDRGSLGILVDDEEEKLEH